MSISNVLCDIWGMPIFAQRRLCSMLSELTSNLTARKFNELRTLVVSTNTKAALAAEAELAIIWAVSRVAHISSEPELPNSSKRPEAYSIDLFESGPAILEVRALSDDNFSGKEAMERTANIVSNYANHLRRGASNHLYFEFNERSYWTTRYHRERCVDPSFVLSDAVKAQLHAWITSRSWAKSESVIRIVNGVTDVFVKRIDPGRGRPKIFCSMPALAYDLERNPLYKALRVKSRQLRGADTCTLRCVVLVDTGSSLLRRLRARPGAIYEISGEEIIRHAIAKLSIDLVVVLSPHRERLGVGFLGPERLTWKVTYFDRRDQVSDKEYQRFEQLSALLPPPRFEGDQARSLHEQGSFSANRNKWPLGTTISVNRGSMTIKLSASLLHDYLAGCIDADRFRRAVFSDQNYFALELARGNSIRGTRFETGGLDADDDYVVFELSADPQLIAKRQAANAE